MYIRCFFFPRFCTIVDGWYRGSAAVRDCLYWKSTQHPNDNKKGYNNNIIINIIITTINIIIIIISSIM